MREYCFEFPGDQGARGSGKWLGVGDEQGVCELASVHVDLAEEPRISELAKFCAELVSENVRIGQISDTE